MSAKQDRQGVRTAPDLEQRYKFGTRFAEILGIATDARTTAEEAKTNLEGLTQEQVFNALTNNGASQGLYRGEDGELYINASYIKSGELLASLIKAGVISNIDGTFSLDIDSGDLKFIFDGVRVGGIGPSDGGFVMEVCNSKGTAFADMLTSGDSASVAVGDGMISRVSMYYDAAWDRGGIHIKDAPEDDEDAVNKAYLETYFMPKLGVKTVKGTTNDNGTFSLGLSGVTYVVLDVYVRDADGSGNYLCHKYIHSGGLWRVNVADVVTKENVVNTAFTATVRYMAIE